MPDFDNSTSAKTDSSEKIPVVSYKEKTTDEWNNLFFNGSDNELKFVGALYVLNIEIDKFKELSMEEGTSLINKSFRRLSLDWHPDKIGRSAESEETFKVLNNAKAFLLERINKNFIPDDFDSAKNKLSNFLSGSPQKSNVQEKQKDAPTPDQKKSYARNPYHEQEETKPEEEVLGEQLRQQREAARNATKQNNNPHPSQSTFDDSVLLNEDELREKLKLAIEVARQILRSKKSSLSNKNVAFSWLINAKLEGTPKEISNNLSAFNSLNLISMLPTSQKSSVPDEPTMGVNQNDKRYQVLSALMKEQQRLMNQYHLVDGKEEVKEVLKDGIRLTTEIGFRSNGKPYYKEDSKVAKTARERVKVIGELAKKLDQSLREHPAGDAKFTDKKIHADLIGLRSKMHGTSLLKGSFVTGRSNITQAMQIVAPKPPKNQPKPGLIENVKRRLGFSK